MTDAVRIAVLVPCYNEEAAISDVVEGFRAALPSADIYVYDNNSQDRTRELALRTGAIVRSEPLQGKGHVVRRMFADVEADFYILVDGDGTYEPASAAPMLEMLWRNSLDMVVGCREQQEVASYRPGHVFGNLFFNRSVATLFGNRFTDILSGYRVFSRRFVKSFPALAQGFEIETELTVHALTLALPTGEFQTPYFARPAGSASKLRTYRDGMKIFGMVLRLFEQERPFLFFMILAVTQALLAGILAWPVITHYLATGLVPRLPTAVLAATLGTLAAISLVSGTILETVAHGRRETRRLAYLQCSAPPALASEPVESRRAGSTRS